MDKRLFQRNFSALAQDFLKYNTESQRILINKYRKEGIWEQVKEVVDRIENIRNDKYKSEQDLFFDKIKRSQDTQKAKEDINLEVEELKNELVKLDIQNKEQAKYLKKTNIKTANPFGPTATSVLKGVGKLFKSNKVAPFIESTQPQYINPLASAETITSTHNANQGAILGNQFESFTTQEIEALPSAPIGSVSKHITKNPMFNVREHELI